MEKLDNPTNWALGFLRTAYKSYIAARVLLNKGYMMQGVMLASTAIEKSFKTSICILTGRKVHGHMDKFEKFKAIIEEKGYGRLIKLIDTRFIDILIKAYKLRYYDTVLKPTVIGFFKNQFLGKLDSTFSLFERLYILNNEKGEKILTPLQMDLKESNPDLFENNWIALKMDKKRSWKPDAKASLYIYIPTMCILKSMYPAKK